MDVMYLFEMNKIHIRIISIRSDMQNWRWNYILDFRKKEFPLFSWTESFTKAHISVHQLYNSLWALGPFGGGK